MTIIACSVTGCPNKHKAKGLCGTHYDRKRTMGDVRANQPIRPQKLDPNAICKIDGCENKVRSLELCNSHYSKLFKYGNPVYVQPPKSKMTSKESYAKHREKILANVAKRRAANPEKFQNYYNTYRARQMHGAYDFTPKDLQRLSRLACAYCGATENLELEHIIPLSRGGRHSIGNTTKACRSCNSSKSDRLLMEWRLDKKSPRYKAH